MSIDPVLIEWEEQFLSGSLQRVRIGKYTSNFERQVKNVDGSSVCETLSRNQVSNF